MDKRDLKEEYPLHIRLGLLITLIGWICAFIFIPKSKIVEYTQEIKDQIKIEYITQKLNKFVEPLPPQKPKIPVAAKTDEEIEATTIDKTGFDVVDKEPVIEEEPPEFVKYDKKPEPLNLNEVTKELVYPEIAKKLRIEGVVILNIWVDKNGDVRKVKVLKGLYPELDSIAVKACYKLKFSPAMNRDIPVSVWVSMPIRFKLEK